MQTHNVETHHLSLVCLQPTHTDIILWSSDLHLAARYEEDIWKRARRSLTYWPASQPLHIKMLDATIIVWRDPICVFIFLILLAPMQSRKKCNCIRKTVRERRPPPRQTASVVTSDCVYGSPDHHPNPSTTFRFMLLTDRQTIKTNSSENITSSVEGINGTQTQPFGRMGLEPCSCDYDPSCLNRPLGTYLV